MGQKNFLVSKIFNLEIGDDGVPSIESIKKIISAIRTFIAGDDMYRVLDKQ